MYSRRILPKNRSFRASSLALFGAILALPFVSRAQSAPASTSASEQDLVVLDLVTVTETKSETPDLAAAQVLKTIPGSTRLVDTDSQLSASPVLSQKAVFAFQPGVYAEGSGTSESVKISIRGSGIGNPVTYNRGINLLFDGLTFPGFTMSGHPIAFNESLGLDRTEVLIGSNGFDYQSLGLGGAINYVSKTGYNADRFQARFDAGSFGYRSTQLSSGQVVGKTDYYASLVSSTSDGFQRQSAKDATRLIANAGYRFNDRIDTRVYVRAAQVKQETPGNLSQNQIRIDREQALAANVTGDVFQESDSAYWVGSKTTVQLEGDAQLYFGGTIDSVPFYINNRGNIGGAGAAAQLEQYFNQRNISYVLGFDDEGELFGLARRTKVAFRGYEAIKGDNYSIDYSTFNPATFGQVVRARDTSGTSNQVLSLSNDLDLTEKLTLRTGVSAIHTKTVNKVLVAQPPFASDVLPTDNSNSVSDDDDYNWVVGLTYDVTPTIQTFTNVSRSVEQPTALSKSNGATNRSSIDLDHQVGITKEIGVRGEAGIFSGSLSAYRTDLRNEFLEVVIASTPTIVTQNNNASPTVHQGIEAGLDTVLWHDGELRSKTPTNRLTLRQSYTLNDFYFKGDANYGENEIPSIPRHIYQAELRLDLASGFFGALNAKVSSDYYFDYRNTADGKVDGYTIYGATIGYQQPKGRWNAYLTFENLNDETYIVTSRPVVTGNANSAVHQVGDPFGVYAGVNVRF